MSRGEDPSSTPLHLAMSSKLVALSVLVVALAACDTFPKTTPPDPPAPAVTRVVRVTLDPDTVAVGDTTLIHVVVEDSLDTRLRFIWSMPKEWLVPVDGGLEGPRVRFVAQPTSGGPGEVRIVSGGVGITDDLPRTRSVDIVFDIPVLTTTD